MVPSFAIKLPFSLFLADAYFAIRHCSMSLVGKDDMSEWPNSPTVVNFGLLLRRATVLSFTNYLIIAILLCDGEICYQHVISNDS